LATRKKAQGIKPVLQQRGFKHISVAPYSHCLIRIPTLLAQLGSRLFHKHIPVKQLALRRLALRAYEPNTFPAFSYFSTSFFSFFTLLPSRFLRKECQLNLPCCR